MSRRAFLQSQVPLLIKQAATGLVARFTPPTQPKGCHLFLQLLGHSASTSRTLIRLCKTDRQYRVVSCSDRSSVMSHNDEIYYGAAAHCLPPLSWRRQSIAVRAPSSLASVSLVANVEPVAWLAFQPKAICRRIPSPFQYLYICIPEPRLLLSPHGLQHD